MAQQLEQEIKQEDIVLSRGALVVSLFSVGSSILSLIGGLIGIYFAIRAYNNAIALANA